LRQQKRYLLLAALILAFLSVSAIRVDRIKSHVAFLAGPDLAGRRSGEPGAVKAAEYIAGQFRSAGFDVRLQEFGINRRNVVARHGMADQHIVIGAHYDGQSAFPSASDNAAGVAVLLELAAELKTMKLPVSVVAIAFDDEEQGLHGSNFYAANPILPLKQVQAALILDTMGRHFLDLSKSTLFVLGSEYSPELAQIVERRGRSDMLVAGVDLIGPRSDFAGFAREKVPFLFFSHATHKDYHAAGDRPELLDYPKLTADAQAIAQIAADIARLPRVPMYLENPVYAPREVDTLLRIMGDIRRERRDLSPAYRLVFADLEKRLQTDKSRSTLNVAASALLALATPHLSPFMLEFLVVPAYQKENRQDIVQALRQEAARWQ
jgi:hypothetical protein